MSCTAEDIERVGMLYVVNYKKEVTFSSLVHLYLVRHWIGIPTGSPEIKSPEWFSKDRLPRQRMLEGDVRFLPRIFAGKNVYVQATYDITRNMALTGFFMEEANRPPWRHGR